MKEIVTIWLTGLMMASALVMLAIVVILRLHAWGVNPLRMMTRFVRKPWFERLLLLIVICGMVHYGATKGTGGGSRSTDGDARTNPSEDVSRRNPARDAGLRQSDEITNLCFTGICVQTNGVILDVAWPTNMFTAGTTLDFFAEYPALTNDWRWFLARETLPGETNMTVFADMVDGLGIQPPPAAMFFKVQDRYSCATSMTDSDGDGLPDVYELHHGTNPYVCDAASVPKLTVGPSADYATLQAALAASTNYSVIALSSFPEYSREMITLPSHPVLVTGPENGFAVLHSSANIAAVLMDAGQGCETLFRNLCVVLEARDNFQSAFWIGGNLPWNGVGASPTFENVRVRALYPNVLHYGWHYYRGDGEHSSVSNCVFNAAGSTSAISVYAYDGPEVSVSDCAFVNIPTNVGSFATWIRSGTNVAAEAASVCTNLSWAGYPLDALYSDTADSDGDGLSDYAEIHVHDTDPWLADSDGDGLSDSAEIAMGTNPRDLYSFYRRVTVVTTASDGLLNMTNYVAWGVSEECWETNGLTAWSLLPSTNVFEVMSTNGPMVVKAYRDLNRNGRYDAEADILLAEQVPPLDAVSRFELRFGDVDGDGWSDGLEIAHGADPFNARNYCFNLSFVEKGIFSTTNQLTAEVLLGTNVLLGPVVMTNRTWACDLGHLIVSNRETIVVYFWDDANSNGVRDVEECSTKQTISIRGHENVITNTLALGAFDRDSDGMLDYWEVLHANAGLSPTNAADAFLDSDQDGLINLHEFWADCDPMFFDGTNTLLSIASLSVDLYLCCGSNVTSVLPRFENYQQNGSNLVFTANTLFWAINCDFGCCSMWNDSMRDMWGGPCCQWNMAGTAISSRHILHSHHYGIPNGTTLYFYGHISGVVSRRLINSIYVGGDLRVGVLDSDLPFDIIPAMVIPSGYESYIGKGTGLPVVTFDQEEMLSVAEISALQDYSARDMDTCAMIPQKRLRQPYYRNIVSGDSGNPRFLVVGNRIALINLLWHGGAGGGCFITHFAESIQLAMDALATGYTLEFLDLSQYDMLPSWR